ncbi:hypothetical protein BpHYR1_022418 [Brachionus plicatilis]|uniref:Uncharacterized protein n=1 Tax=Brachionus plicatilis TaxID=10195 RepID=A0A3M7QB31_BRAPC|nr:hypothetical protein BpHYR1_022418 [Brachionus plicatilis]
MKKIKLIVKESKLIEFDSFLGPLFYVLSKFPENCLKIFSNCYPNKLKDWQIELLDMAYQKTYFLRQKNKLRKIKLF